MHFSDRLLQWYSVNGRPLPWRQTNDPYVVWITEIILQQTRVDQGMEYFYRFLEAFPDVASLAAAPIEKVLRLWQGLGYYSRARNLHAAAKEIIENRNGQLPQTYHDWLKVKGVGPYTAAAIASIAFNEVVPAIDGNGFRVLARIFAVKEKIDTSKGKKIFQEIAAELIDNKKPGAFNQAMMDFGATVCKPASPKCPYCLFNRECLAFLDKSVDKLPLKKERKKPRSRHFNYFYFFWEENDGQTYFLVNQRKDNDIWKNLFELPLIETSQQAHPDKITASETWKLWFPGPSNKVLPVSTLVISHPLTHQTINARFFRMKINPDETKFLIKNFHAIDHTAFEKMPKSKLMVLFLEKIKNFTN